MGRKKMISIIEDVRAAYHDGPPSIQFYGRGWQRGVAQTVTPGDWAAMQARGDFGEFGFKTHPHPNPPLEGEGRISTDPLPKVEEGEIIDKE